MKLNYINLQYKEPISAAAGIAAGLSALGVGGNILAQNKLNKKTREWNEKMYARQREDSLTDWATQNDYNSPKSQMERYRQANLNPHLIYGQGTPGNSEQIRGNQVQGINPKAPQFDTGSIMGAYQDTKTQEAQRDLAKAQQTAVINEAALKAVNTESAKIHNDQNRITLQSMQKYSLEAAELQNKNMAQDLQNKQQGYDNLRQTHDNIKADTANKIATTHIALIANSKSMEEATQRILNLKQDEIQKKYNNSTNDTQRKMLNAQLQNLKANTSRAIKEATNLDLQNERLGKRFDPRLEETIKAVSQIAGTALSIYTLGK